MQISVHFPLISTLFHRPHAPIQQIMIFKINDENYKYRSVIYSSRPINYCFAVRLIN